MKRRSKKYFPKGFEEQQEALLSRLLGKEEFAGALVGSLFILCLLAL